MADRKIRVVIAEDSIFTQKLLERILQSDPGIEVVGVAKNGREAVRLVKELKPDIVTMDIRMPVMDGFQATQIIMSECPTPILVISASVSGSDLKISFNAIQAGALDIIEKPLGSLQSDYQQIGGEIIRRVKMISEIKVFRHLTPKLRRELIVPGRSGPPAGDRAIAIGASTGGPSALHQILQGAPADLPAAVFVTQHISEGFGRGCVDWLNRSSPLLIKVAEDGEAVAKGVVYFSPDRGIMELRGRNRIVISKASTSQERLNIDAMMKSVADAYGGDTVGVLLTGMGNDGVEGMRRVRAAGGTTIAQDESTSVVFGMPRAAIAEGLADQILPLPEILPALVNILQAGPRVSG